MFWESVIGGLKVFTFWETYVAGLMYFAIYFFSVVAIGMRMEAKERSGGGVGCLPMLFVPIAQVAAMIVMVMTLSPIILGFGDDAVWAMPWQFMGSAPFAFLTLLGKVMLIAIILALIPLVGQLTTMYTLAVGGTTLVFVVGVLRAAYPGVMPSEIELMPGFLFILGLIVVGGALSLAGLFIAAMIATAVDRHDEGLGQLVMMPVGAILGLIPVFIYGAWLGLQIRSGF